MGEEIFLRMSEDIGADFSKLLSELEKAFLYSGLVDLENGRRLAVEEIDKRNIQQKTTFVHFIEMYKVALRLEGKLDLLHKFREDLPDDFSELLRKGYEVARPIIKSGDNYFKISIEKHLSD